MQVFLWLLAASLTAAARFRFPGTVSWEIVWGFVAVPVVRGADSWASSPCHVTSQVVRHARHTMRQQVGVYMSLVVTCWRDYSQARLQLMRAFGTCELDDPAARDSELDVHATAAGRMVAELLAIRHERAVSMAWVDAPPTRDVILCDARMRRVYPLPRLTRFQFWLAILMVLCRVERCSSSSLTLVRFATNWATRRQPPTTGWQRLVTPTQFFPQQINYRRAIMRRRVV